MSPMTPDQIEYEREQAERLHEHEQEIAERERQRVEEEEARAEAVAGRLEMLRIDHDARKLHVAEITRQREISLPEVGWTAEQFLADESSLPQPVVDSLHYQGNNTLLVAEFKTGKTTLEINLTRSLVDGRPFLGKFAVDFDEGRVALFNYEMHDAMLRQWLAEADVERLDRIVPLNLRGWQLPFWDDSEMNRVAEWLLQNEVKFLIMDPASKAWRGLVEHEGDNVQLAEFFGAVDELKRLADVPNLVIATHKPRAKEDRARGGGEIEAWPDGNWYLNKTRDGIRSLRAEGRDILLPETNLDWDEGTRSMSAGQLTEDAQLHAARDAAVAAVQALGEVPSTTALMDAMKGIRTSAKRPGIRKAVDEGLIKRSSAGNRDVYSPIKGEPDE